MLNIYNSNHVAQLSRQGRHYKRVVIVIVVVENK